jgi:AcrR family transcriptional regulator
MAASLPATAPAPEAASKGDLTRAAILQAGFGLFARQGYHGTSMRRIAHEAGLAPSAIYNHFSGKEALFAAVLDAYHPYRKVMQALDDADGDSVEALVRDAGRRVSRIISDAAAQIMPLVFIEIVEFQGRHVHQWAQANLPRLARFAHRVEHSPGRLRPIPRLAMLRAFVGLMISVKITETFLKGLPGLPTTGAGGYEDMLDIFLRGVLAGDAALEAD